MFFLALRRRADSLSSAVGCFRGAVRPGQAQRKPSSLRHYTSLTFTRSSNLTRACPLPPSLPCFDVHVSLLLYVSRFFWWTENAHRCEVHPYAGDPDNDHQQLGLPREPGRGQSRGGCLRCGKFTQPTTGCCLDATIRRKILNYGSRGERWPPPSVRRCAMSSVDAVCSKIEFVLVSR